MLFLISEAKPVRILHGHGGLVHLKTCLRPPFSDYPTEKPLRHRRDRDRKYTHAAIDVSAGQRWGQKAKKGSLSARYASGALYCSTGLPKRATLLPGSFYR